MKAGGVGEGAAGLKERQECRHGEREDIPGRGNRMSRGTEVGKGEAVESNLEIQLT